ncbi:MAG: hypothetical protein JRK53_19195, partial [Deltaproteobacteria bacterium]|nr:hypothetical protein [Deltaproteobacteria bacterium]
MTTEAINRLGRCRQHFGFKFILLCMMGLLAFSAPSPAQETRSITGEKVVDRGTFTTDAGDDYDTD